MLTGISAGTYYLAHILTYLTFNIWRGICVWSSALVYTKIFSKLKNTNHVYKHFHLSNGADRTTVEVTCAFYSLQYLIVAFQTEINKFLQGVQVSNIFFFTWTSSVLQARKMTQLSGSKPQASVCLPGPELIGMQLCQLHANIRHLYHNISEDITSVEDPDPYVFGPPGSASESVSHKYGSGSGCSSRCSSRSFHHQANIVRKTLISSVLWLFYDFLTVLRIRIRIRMF